MTPAARARCSNCSEPLVIVLEWDDKPILDRLHRMEQQLHALIEQGEKIMATAQEVHADFDQYKTDVTAAFARLQASLDAALANQGGIPADVQAELDATDAAIKGADADANAEDPAAPPADGGDAPVGGSGDAPAE